MKVYSNYKDFFRHYKNHRTGILTNQSAFGYKEQYHFELYQKLALTKILFLPEHGLFAELQDQVSGNSLQYNYNSLQICNLYGDDENSLVVPDSILNELDLIIIDIRDVGSRYYTFLTTAYYILEKLSQRHKSGLPKIEVLVVDSPNPIGRKIEGTPLQTKYESFVGVRTVLHRHGLTPAELLSYYITKFSLDVKLNILPIGSIYPKKYNSFLWVPPSPNIPTQNTCYVYPGQCLLEGTNLSEGRGTTKPFEIFGAPYINIQNKSFLKELNSKQKGVCSLRPLLFMPTFHKYKDTICGGFQILIHDPKKFHSFLFTLHLLRTIHDFYPQNFEYKKGVYEFRSDKSAIELLAGDEKIIQFLNGIGSYQYIKSYILEQEQVWKKEIEPFKI